MVFAEGVITLLRARMAVLELDWKVIGKAQAATGRGL